MENLNTSFSGSFYVDESLKALNPWDSGAVNEAWEFWLFSSLLSILLIPLSSFSIRHYPYFSTHHILVHPVFR